MDADMVGMMIDSVNSPYIHAVIAQQFEAALEKLTRLMETNPHYRDNYPQTAMLRIFKLLGPGHVLTNQFRPQLQGYTH